MIFERYLTQEDAATLCRLAEMLMRVRDVKVNPAETLIDLVSTSILVPENDTWRDFVTLHSTVTYREIGTDDLQTVVIVPPQDANETLARISILAPLALALIGMPKRSIVEVRLPFNKVRFIEILDIASMEFVAAGPPAAEPGLAVN